MRSRTGAWGEKTRFKPGLDHRGEKNPRAHPKDADVIELRRLRNEEGMKQLRLAYRYGITVGYVKKIRGD